jgi:hypothetical protein
VDLPDAYDDGQAGDEAGQHRPGEEVGDEAQPGETGGEEKRTDDESQQRRQGDEAAAGAGRQRRHGGRRKGGDRRTEADRQLPTGAEGYVRE